MFLLAVVTNGVVNCIYYAEKGVQNDTTVVSNNGGALASSSGGYRMPLVWIDLEMTGELFSYHDLFYVINT